MSVLYCQARCSDPMNELKIKETRVSNQGNPSPVQTSPTSDSLHTASCLLGSSEQTAPLRSAQSVSKGAKSSPGKYRCKRSQKGEAEILVFGIVVIVAGLISGTLYVLHWVKHNKYSERKARQLAMIEARKGGKYSGRRDPAEYLAHCEKPAWALLRTRYECTVQPESYSEIFLLP